LRRFLAVGCVSRSYRFRIFIFQARYDVVVFSDGLDDLFFSQVLRFFPGCQPASEGILKPSDTDRRTADCYSL